MLLKIALILVFSGLVLFVLSLRAASKQDFLAVERLIDGFSHRLLKVKGQQGFQLLFLSLLQSMGCLLLGSKTSAASHDWDQNKGTLSQRYEALEKLLAAEALDIAKLHSEFASWQTLRNEWALALIHKNPLLGAETSEKTEPDQFPVFEFPEETDPSASARSFPELAANWDQDSWKEMQEGAMRLGSLRWAFTDAALMEADLRASLDQCTLIYQSFGSAYSLLRHHLETDQRQALDAALKSWTESLGQCFFSAQTTLRLSRMAEPEDGRRAQAARCFHEISAALLGALSWVHGLEQELFLYQLGGREKTALIERGESFRSLADRLRTETETLCHDIGQTVSEHWRVNEMIYGHPRGQQLVDSMGLKCKGCYVAETESLRSASMVHDFKVETLLTALTEPQ